MAGDDYVEMVELFADRVKPSVRKSGKNGRRLQFRGKDYGADVPSTFTM